MVMAMPRRPLELEASWACPLTPLPDPLPRGAHEGRGDSWSVPVRPVDERDFHANH